MQKHRVDIPMMLLKRAARIRTRLTSSPILLELSQSAPLMEKLSKKYCRRNVAGNPCERYHSNWQYRRILNDVPTPGWQKNFYIKNIYKALKSKDEANILICGLADYAMLIHVLDGCKIARIKPKITVLDSCQTPLEICKWYVERKSLTTEIEFKLENIFNFEFADGTFDLIVTDAYLTQFSRIERVNIVEKWKRWLRTGGTLLTTAKIEESPGKTRIKNVVASNYSFIDREFKKLVEKSKIVIVFIAIRLIYKEMRSAEYARFHPFTRVKEIESIFEGVKLEIDVVEAKPARLYAQIKAKKL